MNEKQRKNLKQQQARRKKKRPVSPPESVSVRRSSGKRDIHQEIDYIVKRAQEGVATFVSIFPLVFFSTATRDAWMLDAEDSLALCLARDGERQPERVMDIENRTAVDWDHEFTIEEDAFFTRHKQTGRETAILGYPIPQILDALEQALENGMG